MFKENLFTTLCFSTLAVFGSIQHRWQSETSEISEETISVYRGETIEFQCKMTSYGQMLPSCRSDAEFLWQTNGMGNAWWITNAVFGSGSVKATWTPNMDAGADSYRFFFQVTDTKGSNYRANGNIEMIGSPYGDPKYLPLPTKIIDFAQVEVLNPTNSPFALKGEVTGVTEERVTNITTDIIREDVATNYLCTVEGASAMIKEYKEIASTNFVKWVTPTEGGSPAVTIGSRGVGNVGISSLTVGSSCIASGKRSAAFGNGTRATGNDSLAEGDGSVASGVNSHAEGTSTTASGEDAHAEGHRTTASGHQAHAEGDSTFAIGDESHSAGINTKARGMASYAGGHRSETLADAKYGFAHGNRSVAAESGSIALGYQAFTSETGRYTNDDGEVVDVINPHKYAFSWQGKDDSKPGYYHSHGDGTFNINPIGGLAGFWVGETNMSDHIDYVTKAFLRKDEKIAWSSLTNDNGVALVNLKDYTYRYEDLSTWHQTAMRSYGWQSIAYANGIYVAGEWQEYGLWYSTNGIAWQQGSLHDGGWFVAHDNGRFVAARNGFRVGYYRGIWYSDDGINWTQSVTLPESFTCLAYGGGKFVACASYYDYVPEENGIWYSSDGITWTRSEQVEGEWGCIAYGGGKFVAGIHDVYSQSHLNGLWYSFDGVNWKQSGKTDGSWQCIACGDGKFVAGGVDSGIWYSDDGINWTQSEKTDGAWGCMTYGNGRFVASSSDSSSFGIWYSDDGINWTQSGETNRSWNCMTYADGRFVAGSGSDGWGGIWYSGFTSETVVPIVQQIQVDGQPIAPDSNNVVNIETKVSKKRYAMFILTMNELRNECSGNWSQFELKASTNNFTTTAIPGEDWRETVKRKMIFMSHSAYADMPGAFETDGMRMYINTRGAAATEKEQWKYHRIRNTSTDPLIRGAGAYSPTDIIVIVDPAMLYLHADAEWLRPDNDDLTWTFLKADENDYERDPEDWERGLWRPTAPVRWLETLPDWAL